MMTHAEREAALTQMRETQCQFYLDAIRIRNHPFIEFTGLINEYINACEAAHSKGIDFSECSKHSVEALPIADFQVDYINEKLECIFSGRSAIKTRST